MAQSKEKHPEGLARARAEQAAERATAARALQDKMRRIEELRILAERRFKRLNRAILYSVLWIGLLGIAFLALGWYWHDIITLLSDMFGLGVDNLAKGK